MHQIQRTVADYVVHDVEDILGDEVSLMVLQGTRLLVTVVDAEGVPASRQSIGRRGDLSGLTVADLETKEVLDLLEREGLGAIADVTWDGGWHRGELRVHAPDVPAAIATLASGLEALPDGRLITEAAQMRPGAWPGGERRDVGGGVAVAAPTDAEQAMGLIDWRRLDGDLQGLVLADPDDDWMASLADALDQAREALRLCVPSVRDQRPAIETGTLRLELSVRDLGPTGPSRVI